MARSLRLFYLFRLLSTSYLYVPVMVAFALSRHLSLLEVFGLNTIYCLTVICCEVPTGALADRLGRRRAMMTGALAMVAACFVYVRAQDFAGFACAEVFAALSMTLCSGADSAYLFDLLHHHGKASDYAKRESTASTWHMAGQAVAFAFGGALAAVSSTLPFYGTAVVAALAFLVALSMQKDVPGAYPARFPQPRELATHMRAAFTDVFRTRRLQWVIAYSTITFVLLRATVYVYQPYLDSLGFGRAEIGLIFSGAYVLAAVVAHATPMLRRRIGETWLSWGLLAVLAVTFLVLGAAGGGRWGLVVLALQGAANGLYSPIVKPLINHEIRDSGRRATVLSVESMVRRAAFGMFSPAIGKAAQSWGVGAGLTLCGLFGLVGLVILVASSRHAPLARLRRKSSQPLTQVPSAVVEGPTRS